MPKSKREKEKKEKKKKVKEESVLKEIFNRIRKRDFSGNTGLVIKNSIYQFSTELVSKGGSFIFTAIIARLLMPELFGYYSLVLSTILIFVSISELGINQTLIRFVSKNFSKNSKTLKNLIFYFGKIKLFLILISAATLLIFARYIAENFYQKPLFLALLAGTLYIIFIQISGFLTSLLQASNNFLPIFKRETIFQIFRIILVPLGIVFAIRYSLSDEMNLMLVILFITFSLFISFLFLIFDVKKTYSKKISEKKSVEISKKQKIQLNKFILATAALILSGVFFGHIDKIMLGRFVEGEFIGYYSAAFTLIGALIPLISFSSIVLLPIFSTLKQKNLMLGLKKSIQITVFLSFLGLLGTLIFTRIVILIIYGLDYIPSIGILRVLAPLLLICPFIAIFQTYYLARNKPRIAAQLLIIAATLNLVLNYILIISLLPYGSLFALYGAAIATLISNLFYLGGLIFNKKHV